MMTRYLLPLAAGLVLASCADQQPTPVEPTGSGPVLSAGAPVLIAAGDIAGCSAAYQDEATARLIALYPSAIVATLGDNVYPGGTASNYSQCYGPSWGSFKSRTRPAPGNHDYSVSGATAYYSYFGSRAGPAGKGYYGYTLGSWRIYSLNSEANLAAETTWLRSDIAAHPTRCILAYWHKPLFSSGQHGSSDTMKGIFGVLYNVRADVVLSGHDHDYERFAKQTPGGASSSNGIRQFVVGTGGAGLYAFKTRKPNSQVRYNGGHGVLRLTLADGSYSWRFLSVAGKDFTDSGSASCN